MPYGLPMFNTLNTANTGIEVAKISMQTLSHNISNANTDGYSRQRVQLRTQNPLPMPSLNPDSPTFQIGTGVLVSSINRIRDSYLDYQYRNANSNYNKWDTVLKNIHFIEEMFQEPTDKNIRGALSQFWDSLEELQNNPNDMAIRHNVAAAGNNLTDLLNETYSKIDGFRGNINTDIKTYADELNDNFKRLANINDEILKSKFANSAPNDLMDKRDLILDEISKLANPEIRIMPDQSVAVSLNGEMMVQGKQYQQIEVKETDFGNGDYEYYLHDQKLNLKSGMLGGLFTLKDDVVKKYLDKLDEFAFTLEDRFNEYHRSGFTLDGLRGMDFFESYQPKTKLDKNTNTYVNDGYYKVMGKMSIADVDTPLGKIDLLKDLLPSGKNALYFTINGTEFDINMDPDNGDSIKDIVKDINNAQLGVEASLSPDNQLVFRGTKVYDYDLSKIQFVDDEGVLASLGFEVNANKTIDAEDDSLKLYRYEEGLAGRIKVSNQIELNPAWIAADKGTIIDNSNAVYRILSKNTFDDITKTLAQLGYASDGNNTTDDDYVLNINGQTVNIDADSDTINDVMDKINAVSGKSGIKAELTSDDRLELYSTQSIDYDISSIDFSVTSNAGTSSSTNIKLIGDNYDLNGTKIDAKEDDLRYYKPSGLIDMLNKNNKVANGPGDSGNANILASLKHIGTADGGNATLNDFLTGIITEIGIDGKTAESMQTSSQTVMQNVENERESVKGVSLDEEMSKMILFQHAFNASARVLSVVDQLIGNIINNLK